MFSYEFREILQKDFFTGRFIVIFTGRFIVIVGE